MEDKRNKRVAKDRAVFTFRLPYEMYQQLEKKARRNGHSINAQVFQAVMADLATESNTPTQSGQS